jgi:hypothetical protein
MPGRWFVRAPDQFFFFEYPKYEGTCTSGFKRSFAPDDDHDETDSRKQTRYTWSDGTRYYERSRAVYEFGELTYEIVRGTVSCMLPDGTLAVRYLRYNSEDGERIYSAIGTRFEPHDDVASGLELAGEIGPQAGGEAIYGLNLVVDGSIAYTRCCWVISMAISMTFAS